MSTYKPYRPDHGERRYYELGVAHSLPNAPISPATERQSYNYTVAKGAATAMSSSSSTLYDAPLPQRKMSVLPWKRREERRFLEAQQARRQADEKMRNEALLDQMRRDLKHQKELTRAQEEKLAEERQITENMKIVQKQLEEVEREKQARALADRRRREAIDARRKAEIQARRRETCPEALQRLRELIRQRHELDNEIWKNRNVRRADRKVMTPKMMQADALLVEIQDTVRSWQMDSVIWTKDELRVATEIRDRLLENGKRNWAMEPPWVC